MNKVKCKKAVSIFLLSIMMLIPVATITATSIANQMSTKSVRIFNGGSMWLTPGVTDYGATDFTITYGSWDLWYRLQTPRYVRAAHQVESVGDPTNCYDGTTIGTSGVWCKKW